MIKYGTRSTIDCPTNDIDKAFLFLKTEFQKIGGNVSKIMNQHDFGEYPSFEVDKPTEFEYIDEENEELQDKYDKWIENANNIIELYQEKFSKYL